jgi:hypothetical protein
VSESLVKKADFSIFPDRANRKNEHLKDKKERAAPVKWDENKQRAINYLFENARF